MKLLPDRMPDLRPSRFPRPLALAILLALNAAPARDFFVSTNGSDTAPGTGTQPFHTIQKAADVMQPGDRCRVRPGTYREWVQPPRGGTRQFAGIWLDWGAQGTRVTGNIVYDLSAMALFIQNTHGGPILVDNNIFSGRVRSTAGNVLFAHNLFADCELSWGIEKFKGVYWQPHSARAVDVVPFVREHNKFFNNIFARRGLDSVHDAPGYESEWNAFCQGARKSSWGDAPPQY